MTESSKAVFLSYASQDAEAARRICEALRAAGIEVWFDQSELRGGDAWDHHIRRQIGDCALFVPIISAHTQARSEGYFRLEWDLADQRSHMIARSKAFIIPVCVDDTPDRGAEVPESFLKVQWSRLPAGETSPAFVERVSRLLSPEAAHAPAEVRSPAAAPHSAAAPRRTAPSPAATQRTQSGLLLIAAVAVMGVGYFTVAKLWLSKRLAADTQTSSSTIQASTPAQRAIPEKSIAVLPFADMSEKKDQEYFADGMAEEILDLLVKIPQLNVIGRTSSFQFKGHNEDLRVIGAKLGAAYIVEGSVRKAGTRIRVTAQLIDASSGVHRWAESYDRDFGDILTLQDQIATSIARALQIAIGADDTRPVRRLESTEAYTLYLHGLSELDQEHSVSLAQAKSDFEQALTLDPSFLRAAEALALTHVAMALDQVVPPDTAWQQAKAAADKALRIDGNSATAHGVLGLVHAEREFDWAAAEEEFSKALALNPHDPVTLNFGARVAHARGRHDEALQRINASLSRDPLNPYAQQTLGWILYGSGDFAGAELALRKSLAISPTFDGSHLGLGEILLVHGQREAALREMQAEVDDESRDVGLAMVNHALGRHAESRAALARLIRSASDRWPFGAAWVHAYRGERDEAFEWLEKDYVLRDPDLLMFIRGDPMFASLRSDPRYTALLRKMNLPE